MLGPIPEADLETHFFKTRAAPFDRTVAPDHLGANGKGILYGQIIHPEGVQHKGDLRAQRSINFSITLQTLTDQGRMEERHHGFNDGLSCAVSIQHDLCRIWHILKDSFNRVSQSLKMPTGFGPILQMSGDAERMDVRRVRGVVPHALVEMLKKGNQSRRRLAVSSRAFNRV